VQSYDAVAETALAALPPGHRVDLELLGERRFGNGVVGLHYGLSSGRRPD